MNIPPTTPPNTWSDDYKNFIGDVDQHEKAAQQWSDDQKQDRDVVLKKSDETDKPQTRALLSEAQFWARVFKHVRS